jgi:hypothetical protein
MNRPQRAFLSIMLFSAIGSPQDHADRLCGALQHSHPFTAFDFDTCRPPAIDTAEKVRFVASLPTHGEVTQLTRGEGAKLRALQRVLRLHAREGVYEIKIVDLPYAATALYGRAVVLISYHALRLLNAEELQAVMAHEIGHEYVWQEYAAARLGEDSRRLRELELTCDAVAVLTLSRLGISPDRLISAVETIEWFNKERFGKADNENNYPNLTLRRDRIKKMSAAMR